MIKAKEVEMMKQKKHVVGDAVWTIEPWTEIIQPAVIAEVHEHGVRVKADIGTYGVPNDKLFETQEMAQEFLTNKRESLKDEYRQLIYGASEIETLQNMVKFAMEHPVVHVEEYTDDCAIEVYQEAAESLGLIEKVDLSLNSNDIDDLYYVEDILEQ